MSENNRCPNCGQIYDLDTDFCPKCDLYGGSNRQFHHGPDYREKVAKRRHEMEHDAQIRLKLKAVDEIKQEKQQLEAHMERLNKEEALLNEEAIDHAAIFRDLSEDTSIADVEEAMGVMIEENGATQHDDKQIEISSDNASDRLPTSVEGTDTTEIEATPSKEANDSSEILLEESLLDEDTTSQLVEEIKEETDSPEQKTDEIIQLEETTLEPPSTPTDSQNDELSDEPVLEEEIATIADEIPVAKDTLNESSDKTSLEEIDVLQQEDASAELPQEDQVIGETISDELEAEQVANSTIETDIETIPNESDFEVEQEVLMEDTPILEEIMTEEPIPEVLGAVESESEKGEQFSNLPVNDERDEAEDDIKDNSASQLLDENQTEEKTEKDDIALTEHDEKLPKETDELSEEQTSVDEKVESIETGANSSKEVEDKSKESFVPPVDIENIPKRTSKEVVKHSNKPLFNRKRVLFAVAAIALLATGAITVNEREKAQERHRIEQIEANNKAYELAKLALDKLYTDSNHTLLKPGISMDAINEVSEKINGLSDKSYKEELTNQLTIAKEQLDAVTSLNSLFESPVLVDNKLQKEVAVKSSTKQADLIEKTTTDEFSELYNKAISQGLEQLKNNKNATKLVAALFDENDELAKTVTDNKISEAEKAVALVKNSELQASQTKTIKSAKKALEKRKEAEIMAEKAEKEAAIAAEKEAINNLTVSIYGQDTLTKWSNKYETKQSGVITGLDAGVKSDDPWVWAPGVQQVVLNECYRRGYIVEGGYELRQKEVKNGEGYYELYATNDQSPLLKKSGAKTPYFIVQINCKTGWFKGTR